MERRNGLHLAATETLQDNRPSINDKGAFAWPGCPDVMIERHHTSRPAPFALEAEKPVPRADIEDRFASQVRKS